MERCDKCGGYGVIITKTNKKICPQCDRKFKDYSVVRNKYSGRIYEIYGLNAGIYNAYLTHDGGRIYLEYQDDYELVSEKEKEEFLKRCWPSHL